MTEKFGLPELGFKFDALEPLIDAKTMEIHHGKHHAAYVNNLNAALENAPQLAGKSIEALLRKIVDVPEGIRQAVINNGGGHANHSLFWRVIAPGGSKKPADVLTKALTEAFKSYEAFEELFSKAATTRFGSGWAWLVMDENKKLQVYSTANQDSPLMQGHLPILGLDVWEHAYYLNYQNRRPDYIKAFWSLVNWDVVLERYLSAK
jgi:Fe-Mn family superoxide dismutase